MNVLITLLTLGMTLATLLRADEFTARDGTVYKDFKVISHDDGFITILYADGGGKIPLSNLPDAMQKQYGYDAAKCSACVKATIEENRVDSLMVVQAQSAAADKKREVPAASARETTRPSSQAPVGAPPPASAEVDQIEEAKKADVQERIKNLQDDIDSMNREIGKESVLHANYSHGSLHAKIAADEKEIQSLQAPN